MTYSVAKPFAALTVLSVVAEGALALDQPVADVWPEYAARGKEATTVRHVLCHQAGLPSFPEAAADVAFDDRDGLTALLAGAEPVHPPGAGHRRARADLRTPVRPPRARRHRRGPGRPVRRHRGRARLGPAPPRGARRPGPGGRRGGARATPGRATTSPTRRGGPRWAGPPGLLDPTVLNSTRGAPRPFPAVSLHASARGLAPSTTSCWTRTARWQRCWGPTSTRATSPPRRRDRTSCCAARSPGPWASRSTRRRSAWAVPVGRARGTRSAAGTPRRTSPAAWAATTGVTRSGSRSSEAG